MAMQWWGKWFKDSCVIILEVRCSEMFASWAKGLHDALNTNQIIWQQLCENNRGTTLNLPHVTLSPFHWWKEAQPTSNWLVTGSYGKWLYLSQILGRASCPMGCKTLKFFRRTTETSSFMWHCLSVFIQTASLALHHKAVVYTGKIVFPFYRESHYDLIAKEVARVGYEHRAHDYHSSALSLP